MDGGGRGGGFRGGGGGGFGGGRGGGGFRGRGGGGFGGGRGGGRGGPRGGRGGGGRGGGGNKFQKSGPDDPRVGSEVQIFVEGLPKGAKVPELVQYFSTVGEVKVDRNSKQPRVHLYKDKATGAPLGEATITYKDTQTQSTALETYNNQMYQVREYNGV